MTAAPDPRAPSRARSAVRAHLLEGAPLVVGIGALALATTFGWDTRLLELVVSPPPVVRLALAIASLILALALVGAAVARMESRTERGGHLVAMLRGVRLAFLALACASVAIGWALGSGLPFVIALVIAGIDVIETTFLLIVVRRER